MKPSLFRNLPGNPMGNALSAGHLIFGGVFDTFPQIEICLPHVDGGLPTDLPPCRHPTQKWTFSQHSAVVNNTDISVCPSISGSYLKFLPLWPMPSYQHRLT